MSAKRNRRCYSDIDSPTPRCQAIPNDGDGFMPVEWLNAKNGLVMIEYSLLPPWAPQFFPSDYPLNILSIDKI